jgi:hypothetical protein
MKAEARWSEFEKQVQRLDQVLEDITTTTVDVGTQQEVVSIHHELVRLVPELVREWAQALPIRRFLYIESYIESVPVRVGLMQVLLQSKIKDSSGQTMGYKVGIGITGLGFNYQCDSFVDWYQPGMGGGGTQNYFSVEDYETFARGYFSGSGDINPDGFPPIQRGPKGTYVFFTLEGTERTGRWRTWSGI